MARFRSWIDLERLRTLVEETAWRPSEPEPFVPTWGELEGSDRFGGGRKRQRFLSPDDYFDHDVPQSRRRTETPTQQPRPRVDERKRRWTGVIDDARAWNEDSEVYRSEHTEPRGFRAPSRVEPPPEPRVEPPRMEVHAEPRIERRAPRANRSVEPPPEPKIPEGRSPLPPPPAFGPGVLYEPPRAGSLEDRLAHLLDWSTDVSGSDVAFVADHEGLLLARRHASDVEEAVAAVLEGFLEQLGPFLGDAVEGHVTLRSHGRVFVVTWHETGIGRFFLGIVGAGAPPPWVVVELTSALASTVAGVRELGGRSPTPAPFTPRHPTPAPIAAPPAMPVASPLTAVAPPPMPVAAPSMPVASPPMPVASPPMPVASPASPVASPPIAPPLPPVVPPPVSPLPLPPPPMPTVAPPPRVAPVASQDIPQPVSAPIETPPPRATHTHAPALGLPAPLAEPPDVARFEPPPLPIVRAEPTPPAEVATTRARKLVEAIESAFDPRQVRLRISLQTGLSVDALTVADTLGDAELDAVSKSLQRILGLDPART